MKEKKQIFKETDRERMIRELKKDFPGLSALDIDIEELVDKIHDNPSYLKKLMVKKNLKEFQTREVVQGQIKKLEPGSDEYNHIIKRMESQKENLVTE